MHQRTRNRIQQTQNRQHHCRQIDDQGQTSKSVLSRMQEKNLNFFTMLP